ncbi:MAG: DUF4340 domain-containing protein [Oscillatoriales cyanobacterium]|nr:MAG: DUF4340 domain-containing protein [Oscillatoriales cyanobacterium]
MKLKRSTQGLLIAALILGVGVAVYEGTIAPERQAQQEQGDRLFKFAALDVQRITIETSDQVLQFDRLETALNVPLNQEGEFTTTDWQFVRLDSTKAAGDRQESSESQDETAATSDEASELASPEAESAEAENLEAENPEVAAESDTAVDPESNAATTADKPTPARQAYIDYLFNAVNGASSDRSISAPANRRAEYGLTTPTLRLTIELKNGTRHTLEIGNRDFTQSFVYALLDTPKDATQLNVLLLPPNFINAFDRDLAAWDATQPLESETELPDPAIEGETPPPTDDMNSEILKDPIYSPELDRNQSPPPEPAPENGLNLPESSNETGN